MKPNMIPSADAFQLAPIQFPPTVRTHTVRGATSFRSGRVVPISFIPVLRGDAPVGRVQIPIRMEETEERLMNAVQVTVRATFVPFLASDRFDGREDFDRAYKKAQFALAMHIGRWAGVQRLRQGRRAALGVWARQRDETIADSCRDTW